MFNQKLVVCIKTAGKVLKEQKDKVYLPFGSEYSIYLKNLNSVRAAVRISLDGVDVTDGTDLIVQPNSSIDLERFIKAGNLTSGNKFKFIERTGKIEAHRGVQAEDGLLRVEFQFEKLPPKVETIVTKTIHEHYDYYRPWYSYPYYHGPYYNYLIGQPVCGGFAGNLSAGLCDSVIGSSGAAGSGSVMGNSDAVSFTSTMAVGGESAPVNVNNAVGNSAQCFVNNVSGNVGASSASVGSSVNYSAPVGEGTLRSKSPGFSQLMPTMDSFTPEVNDAGITVAGSRSDQTFHVVSSFPLEEEKHVIVLKLLGKTADKVVKQAVTTKTKQTCPTCGTRNRGKMAAFCRECGTALEIV